MDRCRFAVTVVPSDLGQSSGPHPIRRYSPSKDGRLSTPYGALRLLNALHNNPCWYLMLACSTPQGWGGSPTAFPMPTCPTAITHLMSHPYASAEGQTAQEREPKGKAAAELASVWDWLKSGIIVS